MTFQWSALIIDEGHRLKGENSTLAKELRGLQVASYPGFCVVIGPPLDCFVGGTFK